MSDEQLAKNMKEQYEMLGRFVAAFERMVSEVREGIIGLFERDRRAGILAEIAMHHAALSAKPLFEIMRAAIVEIVNETINDDKHGITRANPLSVGGDGKPLRITVPDRDTICGVLTLLQGRYDTLVNRRNDLLHGTWFVGYTSSEDPAGSQFHIRKLKTSRHGLVPADDLPKSAAELAALSERCEDIRNWIAWLMICLEGSVKIADTFQRENGTWWFVTPAGDRSTLA